MKPDTDPGCAKFVSVTHASDYVQFCGITIFMTMDKLSEMSNQGGCQAIRWDRELNCFSTMHRVVVLLLKNRAPTPALWGLFDVPVDLHHLKKAPNYISEIVVLSFQALPCVSLPDNSSLRIWGAIIMCSSLGCFFATLSSGALLSLQQERSTSKFVMIHFLTNALIRALERRHFSHPLSSWSVCRPFLLGWI